MNEHLSDAVVQAFASAELDDALAVEAALHLDACPRCSSRVVAADPMHFAFSDMADPSIPPDLVAKAVAEARRPRPLAFAEVAVGLSLLASAALLGVLAGEPLELLFNLSVAARATWVAAGLTTTTLVLLAVGMGVSSLTASAVTFYAAKTLGGQRSAA